MVSHMKTTVDIPDELMRRLKALAAKRGVPLRVIVEEAFREILRASSARKPFQLPDCSFGGDSAGASNLEWSDVREEIYRGRGS